MQYSITDFQNSVAGGDTTATAIRATMLFIMTNPAVYKKLQAEIDSVASNSQIISEKIIKSLPYLQATIKKGVRMWPPAPVIMPKVTPPDGDIINGVFVPEGTEIAQCAWGLHRYKKVYGEDSMVFEPDRWLRTDGMALEAMERSLALTWEAGKYQCLRKNIALLEPNKVLFEVSYYCTLLYPHWNSQLT